MWFLGESDQWHHGNKESHKSVIIVRKQYKKFRGVVKRRLKVNKSMLPRLR